MEKYLKQLKHEFDTAILKNIWPPFPIPQNLRYPETNERHEMFKWILDQIDLEHVVQMLDVGMLGGRFIEQIQQISNCNCDGIDLSSKAVEYVKKKKLSGRYICTSMTKIPFASNYYDWVNCISVMEYNPLWAVRHGLREINRVLKPRGQLTINFPDESSRLARKYKRMEEYMGTEFYLFNDTITNALFIELGFFVKSSIQCGMAKLYLVQKI